MKNLIILSLIFIIPFSSKAQRVSNSVDKPFSIGVDLLSALNRSTLNLEADYFVKDFFSVHLGAGNQFTRNHTNNFKSDTSDLQSSIQVSTKGYFINPGVKFYYLSKTTNRPLLYIGLNVAIINYDYSGETSTENYYGNRVEKFEENSIGLVSKDLAFGFCTNLSENISFDIGAKLISFTQRTTQNTGTDYSVPYVGFVSGSSPSSPESLVHFQLNALLKYNF